ncbi:hypothetical protein INT45_001009 [Circinella minor]|uniref:Uncharacterized protein n=1 Tax=Circinella minor TaxID=1195481 RepID=A0A8H7SEF1_9FUNG|nr:hypothetical protein INT45_001009 [Circinella minor]
MGFFRRANKKKEKILPVSPTVTTSFSSPGPFHLKLNNETMGAMNNNKTSNYNSKIQAINGYTNRAFIESSLIKSKNDSEEKVFFNAGATSSPTSLINDTFLELNASKTNIEDSSIHYHNNPLSPISSFESPPTPIKSSDFDPTDAVPLVSRSISSRPSNVNSIQEVDVSHSNIWKETEKDLISPTATIDDSTRTAMLGPNHPVNSTPNLKENSRTSTNSSPTNNKSNVITTIQAKSTLFKHKAGYTFDSDASGSEEEEENNEDNDNGTDSFLSSNISSETNIPSNHIKQQKQHRPKGPANKTSTAADASNSNLSGRNSGVPSQATLMSRMKERHRQECRKSWQPVGQQQHNQAYLKRLTPTMPIMYKMDAIISPLTSEIPTSESAISFASVSHLSAASPTTTQTIDANKQQRQQKTIYRSRLPQPLSIPYALENIVSRGSIDRSITSWRPTASVTLSKRNSIMKKLNRSARASSWSISRSHQQQRPQQKDIFSNGPGSFQLADTPSTMSPPSSPISGYYPQQHNANVVPRLIPVTPPPDDINSPIISPTELTQSMLDIKDVACKEASEFERMHKNRSLCSLPDLSQFETTMQKKRSHNKCPRFVEKPLNGLNKESVKPKVKNNNNETTTSSTIKNHETPGLDEGNGTTSCSLFSSVNGDMELGHKQLLPLGDTLPTVLVVKESGLSQYYLLLSQDQHFELPSFQHRYNHYHRCCHNHKKGHHHHLQQHQCDGCPMQKQTCCHNYNQQHRHHCRHNLSLSNASSTQSSKRQNKCNRSRSSGKLCNHHQQQQQKQ